MCIICIKRIKEQNGALRLRTGTLWIIGVGSWVLRAIGNHSKSPTGYMHVLYHRLTPVVKFEVIRSLFTVLQL